MEEERRTFGLFHGEVVQLIAFLVGVLKSNNGNDTLAG
jgi:hypothetical protein